jgi:replicative DNA helicase
MTASDLPTFAPPSSREAEEAVIGSILISEDLFHVVRLCLPEGPREFYIHRLRFIWESFTRLIEKKSPIDFLTVGEDLEAHGLLEEVGGPAFLTLLLNSVGSTLNVDAYATIVHEKFVRRELLAAANTVATVAYDEAMTLQTVTGEATHVVSQAVKIANANQIESIQDVLARVDHEIEIRTASSELPGIPTGLIDLDNTLGGGAQNSDLNLLAGRPGDGKTSLLLQLALHSTDYTVGLKRFKKRVAIFSLEMPTEQLVMRIISQMTGIDFQLLRAGRIPKDCYSSTETRMGYYDALSALASTTVSMIGKPGMSPSYIRSNCEIIAARDGLDIVFVDSLNLMRADRRMGKTSEEVDYNAQELKNIALDFDIPLWCTHQQNRGTEYSKDKPTLSSLREGGEQPADGVVFIYHDKDAENGPIKLSSLIVAKQRNGPTREIPVIFDRMATKFKSVVRLEMR